MPSSECLKRPADVVGHRWEAIKAVSGQPHEERQLHSLLDEYRVCGEWFTVSCMGNSDFQRIFGNRDHQTIDLAVTRQYTHTPEYSRVPRISPRSTRMIELRQQGKTLKEIGDEFGVTRESVRQVIKKHNGCAMPNPRSLDRDKIKQENRFRIGFAKSMKSHLFLLGIIHCWGCEKWTSDHAPLSRYSCRKCNTDRQFERFGTRPDLRGMPQSERVKILISEGKCLRRTTPFSEEHRAAMAESRRRERATRTPEYRRWIYSRMMEGQLKKKASRFPNETNRPQAQAPASEAGRRSSLRALAGRELPRVKTSFV